jgi:hypothetical protein
LPEGDGRRSRSVRRGRTRDRRARIGRWGAPRRDDEHADPGERPSHALQTDSRSAWFTVRFGGHGRRRTQALGPSVRGGRRDRDLLRVLRLHRRLPPSRARALGLGPGPDRPELAVRQLRARAGRLLAVRDGVPAAGPQDRRHRDGRPRQAARPGPAGGDVPMEDACTGHLRADPRAGAGRGSGDRADLVGPRHG